MTHITRLLVAAIVVSAAGCALIEPVPPAATGPAPAIAPAPSATPAAPAACPPCTAAPAKPAAELARYETAAFSELPGWPEADARASLRAFRAGCDRRGAHRALQAACEAARALVPQAGEGSASPDNERARASLDNERARAFFEHHFTPWRLRTPEGGGEGLVTGYYEPVIEGSRTRTARFRHPAYGVPPDLVTVDLAALHPELAHQRLRGRLEGRRLVPYYSRAEIEQRGESLGAEVIAWVADAVELFFLQVQGSGQVRLPGGDRLRLAYADQNGHPYRSLGRALIERGALTLEQASMQGIKAWAAANPARLDEALQSNPSYVFFRETPATGHPAGALGVPLTPGYSIAVDPRSVPLGAPVWLDTTRPLSSTPLQRLVLAQDTGGAIRGAVRADFYWGSGEEAGAQAGRMRQQGAMWLLWPRGATPAAR